jgi:hypothetical protein
VHIIPRGEQWVLISAGNSERGLMFNDLGRALDAATRSEDLVHVVVHEREAR